MKTLLITLVVFALLAGGVLAFAGSSEREDNGKAKTTDSVNSTDSGRTNTGSDSTNSSLHGEDSDRSANRSSSDDKSDDNNSDEQGKNRTANRSSSDDEKEGRNSTGKVARELAKKMSEDMQDAVRRCAQMGNRTEIANCLLQAANASLYADEPLRVVNESSLRCANASTARERAACRLSLKREEQEKGLYYMPEECRNLTGEERATCLSRYDAIQPCRFEKGDDARFKCVRARIGLNASAKELVAECKLQVRGNGTNASVNDSGNVSTNASAGNDTINDTTNGINGSNDTNTTVGNGTNTSIDDDSERGIGGCVAAVRARVFEDAKFRIYNLEEKAERLAKYGVSNETIAEFIVKLEELKAQFVAAEGVEAKKAVLRQAEEAWKEFLAKARAEAQGSQPPPAAGTNQTASNQTDTGQNNTNQSGETP